MATLSAVPASLPALVGYLPSHYYGLCIALGVIAAVWLSRRRWSGLGHEGDQIVDLAFWAVPGGLVGARLYSVITDFNRLYADHPGDIIKVWKGGLGIPGGVIGGVAVGVWYARRHNMSLPALFDVVAPALPLAQAIGRFGNWFNQELYGRPTKLPWALEIGVAHRTPESALVHSTFHPTFAYEALWNLGLVGILLTLDRWREREPGVALAAVHGFFAIGIGADLWLVVQQQRPQAAGVQAALFLAGAVAGGAAFWALVRLDRRGPRRRGDLFAVYVAGYFVGRMWVESLRIDTANAFAGLRVNEWTSLVAIVAAVTFLTVRRLKARAAQESATSPATPSADGSNEGAASGDERHAAEVADPGSAAPHS